MTNNTLPEFQEFLRSRAIVPDKSIPFYAYWVSRFIVFGEDWQVEQAQAAVK